MLHFLSKCKSCIPGFIWQKNANACEKKKSEDLMFVAKIERISKESVSWKGRGGVTPSVRPTRLRLDYIHMTMAISPIKLLM